MKRTRAWVAAGCAGGAVLAGALAWLAVAMRESAMAVVLDVAAVGLVAGLVGLVFAGLALRLGRGTWGARARGRAPAPAFKPARLPGPLLGWIASTSISGGVGMLAGLGLVAAVAILSWFHVVPITTSEITFRSGDVVLAGTVAAPRGGGPFPGAVLVHGSGPEARDELIFYARFLARRGIVALAYDKRGIGASEGELYDGTFEVLAEDALAGLRTLRVLPTVNTAGVGLVGFSEAEWVIPIAANRSQEIAFVAVVGASGMSPSSQVSEELAMRLRTRGYEPADVEAALELHERVLSFQRSGEAREELNEALRAARAEPWFADAEDIPEEVAPPEAYPWLPWWRAVMDFDALPLWERVDVPVLLVKGGRDDRSPPDSMRSRLVGALGRGGHAGVEAAGEELEDARVEGEGAGVEAQEAGLAGEVAGLAGEEARIAGEEARIAGEVAGLAGEEARVDRHDAPVEVRVFPEADHMILEWPNGDGVPPPRFATGYPDILAAWIRDMVSVPTLPDRP